MKNILLTPKSEWARIETEQTTPAALYVGYVVILAAIGPICSAVGAIVFGWGAFGVSFHPPILSVLVSSAVAYILSLASVFVLGLIIDALAPTFGGQKSASQALKLAVYSSTASWVVGVFGLLPVLAPLSIVGLYSLYLLYLGLPRLMKAPEDKALPYTAVIIIAGIVLAVVAGMVVAPLRMMGSGFGAHGSTAGDAVSGTVKIGGTSVDVGKVQAAAQQMQAAMAGALNVNSSKETAAGYEKVSTIDGRMTTEAYDRTARTGKFGVVAGGHVMVEARGRAVTIDELKAAVAAVGPDRIEALSRK